MHHGIEQKMMALAQSRDLTLDITKAICIILMVIGHSGCPEHLHRFIYMFHMPCFFFVSGYLLSGKYVANLKLGLVRKARSSYWPFIKWQLIFLLMHNLFARLNFYSESYTLHDLAIKTGRILAMSGGEQLLGGFWFLISLFWASVFTLLFSALLQRRNKLTSTYISGGVILMLVLASTEYLVPFNIPAQFREQTIMATAFYMTGFLFRKSGIISKMQMREGLMLFTIPFVVAIFCNMSMFEEGWILVPYYFVAMCGTLGVIMASRYLAESEVSSLLTYIGDKTLYILVFHFFAFKVASYVYIICSDHPIQTLTQFPTIDNVPCWLWVAYSTVGVVVPLLIWELNNKITQTFKKITSKE